MSNHIAPYTPFQHAGHSGMREFQLYLRTVFGLCLFGIAAAYLTIPA